MINIMDQDASSGNDFDEKVEDIFKDVLQLEHHPPHEGMDGFIHDQTASVFSELAQLVKSLRPKPDNPLPSIAPVQISHSTVKSQPKTTSLVSMFRDIIAMASIALIVFSLFNFAFFRYKVSGPSMEPSISHENYLMINQWAYSNDALQRGDIIALYSPQHPDELYVKRIIAVPGDEVEIIGGWLYINDLTIDEPYLGTPDDFDYPPTVVPENTVFVLGDNRRISEDSRSWGPVPLEYVIGRADFVYWPIRDLGFVDHYHSAILSP